MFKICACLLKTFVVVSVLFSTADVRGDEPPQHRFRGPRRQYAQVSNVSIAQDDAPGVEFDITWDHAWRDAESHDAAWVFFKARDPETGEWKHIRLAGSGLNPEGYSTGNGTDIELIVPDDGMGAFVRRAEEGSGTVDASDVRVLWDGEASALQPEDEPELRGFAIEMVYVPEGAFYLGWAEEGEEVEGQNIRPLLIESEDAVKVGGKELHEDFPKGYGAFYCMKYPLTQGQWVDFFNTLTPAQKIRRDLTGDRNHAPYGGRGSRPRRRNDFRWDRDDPESDAETGNPYVACNYLAWADGIAFAAWAGLRPMSELEHEKACRGPLYPVPGEYAWGTNEAFGTRSSDDGYIMENEGTIEESVSIVGTRGENEGNSIWRGTARGRASAGGIGIVRAGIFQDEDTGRVETGGSYWGIMELSGNLRERLVRVNRPAGRALRHFHGDGQLTPCGEADVVTWPDTDSDGAGTHGGDYRHGGSGPGTVSRQISGGDGGGPGVGSGAMRGGWKNVATLGWRGVRTAPPEAAY